MASPTKNKPPAATLESHVKTVLVSVITAAIIYVSLSVTDLKTSVAVVQASVTRLEAKASVVEGDHYIITDLQRRMEKVEARQR